MKPTTDPVDRSGSTAIAAPHVVQLDVEDTSLAAQGSHVVQLSAGSPVEAPGDNEDGLVIHEMPRASETGESARRAA